MKKLSESLGFGPRTIKRHAEKHGLWRSGWSRSGLRSVDHERKALVRREEARLRNREKWLKLRQDYPNQSRSELRELANRVAGYLSKYDSDWYEENSPKKIRRINPIRSKEWAKIDNETLEKVMRAKKEIEDEYPFVKVTKYGLADRIGQRTLLVGRLRGENIPKTKEYVYDVLETNEEYAVRRLRNRINHFYSSRDLPTLTVFKQSARINYSSHNRISKEAYDALRNNIEYRVPLPKEWESINYKRSEV